MEDTKLFRESPAPGRQGQQTDHTKSSHSSLAQGLDKELQRNETQIVITPATASMLEMYEWTLTEVDPSSHNQQS